MTMNHESVGANQQSYFGPFTVRARALASSYTPDDSVIGYRIATVVEVGTVHTGIRESRMFSVATSKN